VNLIEQAQAAAGRVGNAPHHFLGQRILRRSIDPREVHHALQVAVFDHLRKQRDGARQAAAVHLVDEIQRVGRGAGNASDDLLGHRVACRRRDALEFLQRAGHVLRFCVHVPSRLQ
jgi:hypothetical protein